MANRTATRSVVGRERDHNEDAVQATAVGDGYLLVVADGMGGHKAGDVASELAVEAFVEQVHASVPTSQEGAMLERAVATANERVHDAADDQPGRGQMGTTLVGAYLADSQATIINVGDSRAYHITTDGIQQVTTDHSLVQELLDAGTITEAEAEDYPQRNVVSQALGTDASVDPDVYDIEITGTLLLCSDGLTEEIDDATIQTVVTGADSLESAATTLVERANEQDGSDNITVALYKPA